MALRKNARYGDIEIGKAALSRFHTNYSDNERILHTIFANVRILNTELFDIDFDTAVSSVNEIKLEFKDETKRLEEQANIVCEGFKKLLFGGFLNG